MNGLRSVCFLGALAVSSCVECTALDAGHGPSLAAQDLPGELRTATEGTSAPTARMASISEGELTRARSVTLAEVLRTARTDALAVLESAARLDAAAGRARAAAGELWPGLGVELGASHVDGRVIGSFGEEADVSFNRFEPSVSVYYRVNPGAGAARSDARHRDADAAAMDVADAENAAMLEAALAYYNLRLSSAARDVAIALLHDSESFLAIALARAEADLGDGGNVARAESEAAAAREAATRAHGRWEEASIRLAVLLRWPTGEWLRPREGTATPSLLMQLGDVEELQQAATAARPDLEAAVLRAAAAAADRRAARWDLLGPEIDAGLRGRFVGTDLADLGSGVIAYAAVGWSFDLGGPARIRAAEGEARAAELRAEAIRERVAGEVAAAASRVRTARTAITDATARLEAATRNREIQVVRFEAGTGLGIEVIDAQNVLARARLGLSEAVVRFDVAQVELAASAGLLSPELVDDAASRRRREQTQGDER